MALRSLFLSVFFFISLLLTAQNPFTDDVSYARSYSAYEPRPDEQKLLQKVQYYMDITNFEEALFAVNHGLAFSPESVQLLLKRAEILDFMNRRNEADKDRQRAQRLNPTATLLFAYEGDGSILTVLAGTTDSTNIALSNRNRINAYYRIMDKSYAERGLSEEELTDLENILNQVNLQNYPEATRLTDGFLEKYPNSAAGNDLRGTLYLREKNYPAARKSLTAAVSANPDFAVGYYNLGRLAIMEKDFKTADDYFAKAIEVQPDLTKAYYKRARLNQQLGRNRVALADYDVIIEREGELYPEAYLGRSYLRKTLGDFAGALADLNRVIENRRNNNPELLLTRGNLLMVLDRPKEAIADYTELISKSLSPAEAYYNRGLAFLTIADFTSACLDLQRSEEAGYLPAQKMKTDYCNN